MTERDIRGYFATVSGAIAADNESVAIEAALQIAEQAFVDLHRIADALEALASAPLAGNPALPLRR